MHTKNKNLLSLLVKLPSLGEASYYFCMAYQITLVYTPHGI